MLDIPVCIKRVENNYFWHIYNSTHIGRSRGGGGYCGKTPPNTLEITKEKKKKKHSS